MVHQHFMFIPVMTIAENIVLGNEPVKSGPLGVLDRRSGRASASSELSDRYGLAVDPDARHRGRHGRHAAARRDPQGALPRRPHPGARRADGGADRAGDHRADGRAPARSRRTAQRSSSSHTSSARCSRSPTASPFCAAASRWARSRARAPPSSRSPRMVVGRDVIFRVDKAAATPGHPILDGRRPPRRWTTAGSRPCAGPRFNVRAGEIVALAGVDGNGQTELVEAITGIRAPADGRIAVDGTRHHRARRAPRERRGYRSYRARPPPASVWCCPSRWPRTSGCTATASRR